MLAGKVVFFPVGFSLEGYNRIFSNDRVLTGFFNSILYTVAGTTVNIVMTVPGGVSALPQRAEGRFGGHDAVYLYDDL